MHPEKTPPLSGCTVSCTRWERFTAAPCPGNAINEIIYTVFNTLDFKPIQAAIVCNAFPAFAVFTLIHDCKPLYKIPCKAFQAFPLLFIGKAIIIADFFGLRFIPFTQFIRWANISERGIACYNGNPRRPYRKYQPPTPHGVLCTQRGFHNSKGVCNPQ